MIKEIVHYKIVRNTMLFFFRNNIWRKRVIKKYLQSTDVPKLQIGCGKNLLSGWLNTGIRLGECRAGAYIDAGKPFPLPDASFNYVFSEHLFEHLTYQQGVNILKESYRILKPEGVIRIATPDLQFLLRLYEKPEEPIHKKYIEYSAIKGGLPSTSVFVINRFHTAWGHQIIYDKDTLTTMLEEAGFKDIIPCKVGKSMHSALNRIEGHFKGFPYEFNLLETMILEASK